MTGPHPIFDAVRREAHRIEGDAAGWFRRPGAGGHGHVVPRPDGVRARCGGPAVCRECAAELAALSSQTPASQPVNLASAPAAAPHSHGGIMSLITLEDTLKQDLTQGISYLKEMAGRLEQAAPGIIATTDAVAAPLVGKLVDAVAGRVLPPGLEPVLLGLIDDFLRRNAAPVQPQQPVQAAQPAPAQ